MSTSTTTTITTKTLTASCHCKSVSFTLTLPANILPLNVHLCSCTVCRRTHGAPCSFHAPLPPSIAPEFIAPSSIDNLTPYKHPTSQSTRFFCTTCGCHIGDRDHNPGNWYISVSIFDANASDDEAWYFIGSHAFTHSTQDGGISALLPRIEGRDIPVWNPEDDKETPPTVPDSKLEEETPGRSDSLLAKCHCGGVSFAVSRPRDEYLDSPRSRGWVPRSHRDKWFASVDVCYDCRLVTGTNAIFWLFVPTDHISPQPPADLIFGSMKAYESSEGTRRTFCGTCGATVFYYCEGRPGIVDVATGILRAPEGSMLADWAVWRTARLGWSENALRYDAGFTRGLEEGLKEWGVRMHGETTNFILGQDAAP
ncbi:GFA family protein [Aspergillus lucknowensis]|uniref:Mss4-like protein n=1 Tax=Aspergillus lucknowensis TaxID=176173 RepID=A0ABR4LCF3_9EURO